MWRLEYECPECGNTTFSYLTECSQDIGVELLDDEGRGQVEYGDEDVQTGDIIAVHCKECGYKVPEDVWMNWIW